MSLPDLEQAAKLDCIGGRTTASGSENTYVQTFRPRDSDTPSFLKGIQGTKQSDIKTARHTAAT